MSESLLDTNVLVHAAYTGSPLHLAAAKLLDRGLKQRGVHCIAPQNLLEFCAVLSRGRLVAPPAPPERVLSLSQRLYQSRQLRKIYPARGTIMRAIQEGVSLAITGPRWYDLFLALTMRDAGIGVVITENARDFAGLPFVKAVTINDAI